MVTRSKFRTEDPQILDANITLFLNFTAYTHEQENLSQILRFQTRSKQLVHQHLSLHFQPILNKSSNKEIAFSPVNNSESVRSDKIIGEQQQRPK